MSKLKLFIAVLLTILTIPQIISGKNLKAYLDYSRFLSPVKNSTMIELYLSIDGNSLNFIKKNNGFTSSVFIQIEFKDKEGLKYIDKFNLNSPDYPDTNHINYLFKTQKRIVLLNGTYTLKLTLKDNNNSKNEFSSEQEITLGFEENSAGASDIQLLESYTKTMENNENVKNGYELKSYISNFYPEGINKLTFYAEIYNLDKSLGENQEFLMNYSIVNPQSKKVVGKFNRFSKKNTKNVVVILSEFDIKDLPSGNYSLLIEAKDKNNKTLTSKEVFFQRSNPSIDEVISTKENEAIVDLSNSFVIKLDEVTLSNSIKYLRPIASTSEKNSIRLLLKSGTLENKQRFFHSFWVKRDASNPENAWNEYSLKVKYVNGKYRSYPMEGFEADRGRVFLQYGAPNQIVNNENDMSRSGGTKADPYEIWHYYKANNETNRIFVFHQQNLASDYVLIHSDVSGEITNYQWQKDIYRNVNDPRDPDKTYDRDIYKVDR